MDKIKKLFNYQKFAKNAKLDELTEAVRQKYLAGGEELDDENLDLAAAGEVQGTIPGKENNGNHGK